MKIFFLTIILLSFIITNNSLSQTKEFKTNNYKTKIIIPDKIEIFPIHWTKKPINAKYINLNSTEIKRSLKIINKSLSKYPSNLVQNNLKNIYIVKDISIYNTSIGGTNSRDSVYIENKGLKLGSTNILIEQIFHAEFSSILLRNNKSLFLSSNWIKINPKNFQYKRIGIIEISKNRGSQKYINVLNKSGFLNQYAMSTLENDFNSFAKRIFKADKSFWTKANKYKRLNKKLDIVLQFYQKLDPVFSKSYFIDISKK